MKLFLVRHGETQGNVEGIVLGWRHSPLTPLGIEQARDVAVNLSDKDISLIISSDLGRAIETTDIIAKRVNTPVLYDWLLRERYNGKLEGASKHEVDWDVINANGSEAQQKEVEPIESIMNRGKAFIDNLKLLPRNTSNILVVSHSGLLNGIILSLNPQATYREIGNSEIVEIEFDATVLSRE